LRPWQANRNWPRSVSLERDGYAGFGVLTDPNHSVSRGEQHVTESAVLPAEVEQLPDLAGHLKFESHPAWLRIRLDLN
jgi:hypothetical protein